MIVVDSNVIAYLFLKTGKTEIGGVGSRKGSDLALSAFVAQRNPKCSVALRTKKTTYAE